MNKVDKLVSERDRLAARILELDEAISFERGLISSMVRVVDGLVRGAVRELKYKSKDLYEKDIINVNTSLVNLEKLSEDSCVPCGINIGGGKLLIYIPASACRNIERTVSNKVPISSPELEQFKVLGEDVFTSNFIEIYEDSLYSALHSEFGISRGDSAGWHIFNQV